MFMSSGMAELAMNPSFSGCPRERGFAAKELLIPGRMESLCEAYSKSLSWGARDAWSQLPPGQDTGRGPEPNGALVIGTRPHIQPPAGEKSHPRDRPCLECEVLPLRLQQPTSPAVGMRGKTHVPQTTEPAEPQIQPLAPGPSTTPSNLD